MISLNFTRADLIEIIHIIAQHLKLTYTIDPEVKGTVTINSAEPLRSEDLLPIFHQILRMNGAVAVKSGNLYRIVPIKDGKTVARPIGQSREDSFALRIVPVKFFSVAEMKRVLTPFLMPGAEIVENPRGNFLIIIDLPSNIQRLVEIAEMIDVQVFAGTRMEIYQPKVASAEELAQEMTKIMQSFGASAPQAENFNAEFIALPRINQLLVISHSDAAWSYAKRWIDRIDVITEGPGRRIFIYSVENGKAAELAEVLGQALGQQATTARSSLQSLQSLHRSTTGGTGFGIGSRTTTTTGGLGTSTSTGTGFGGAFATVPTQGLPAPPAPVAPTPPPAPVPSRPPTPGIAGTPGSTGTKPDEQLRIVADPGTNSLIIFGTAQEFQNIKNILKELDAVPRQVLMDVLIAEVTLNNDENFGIDFEIGQGNRTIFEQTFGSRGSVLTGVLGPLQVTPAPISRFPGGISGIIGSSQTVRALINALQADSRVRILSSPSILATDNRPARIQVGSEEPIATGSVTSQVGTAASSTTIQYRNTGRIVTIIPQVNSQGLVNLQILAEVSQRGTNVLIGQDSFPSFDTRQAETTAVVQDGDTLAIGGIITENKSRDRTGIPYLMDVPFFGWFFGSTNESLRRTELVMLITPNVIRNRQESYAVTEELKTKLSTVRNELERIREERERELERMKRLPPPQPEIEPQPSPGPVTPKPDAAIQPRDPAARQSQTAPPGLPPAPNTAAPMPAAVGDSDTAHDQLGASMSDVVDVQPEIPRPVTPMAGVSIPATPELDEQAAPSPADSENTDFAAAPAPPAVNLAKAAPDEQARPKTAPAQAWVVQVVSYAKEADALSFAGKLKEKGYKANVVAGDVDGQPRYRVEVGPLSNRNDALAVQAEIAGLYKLDRAFIITRRTNAGSSAEKR